NVARVDRPNALPAAMPWLTWVTTPRVPRGEGAGPNDAVLLADPGWRQAARDASWPADRIHLAGWPVIVDQALRPGAGLAIAADTRPVEPPDRLSEFSSHLLLWERLRADLARDPFRVGADVHQFLARMLRPFS